MDSLMRRLERLERENRSWRIGGSFGFLAAALVIGTGAGSNQDPQKPRSLTIVDENGRDRILLRTDGDEAAQLTCLNAKGRTRFVLEERRGIPSLKLYNREGGVALSIEVDDQRGGQIYTYSDGKRVPYKP